MREDPPEWTLLRRIRATLRDRYRAAEWELPSDFMSYEHYLRVVQDMDMTSSPGYPLLRQFTTNKQLFGAVDGTFDQVQLHMVWQLVQQRLAARDSDPIRLFVKPEPITQKKLEAGRNRLISSVSVIDQIIDSMLFSTMNRRLHCNYIDLPSKVGWSPYVGGWKIIPPFWWASDKSAWDWTATMWLAQEALELRSSLCKTSGEQYDLWLELAHWRYSKLYIGADFIASSGLRFKAKFDGMVKSGSVNTIDDNSIMQDLLHIRVCMELGHEVTAQYIMGDDVLQQPPQEPAAYYNLLGQFCRLKQVTPYTEFAGHRFDHTVAEPLYYGKHCFNLLHVKPSVQLETANSYSLLYHRSAKKDFIARVCNSLGGSPPDVNLDVTFDGE